jgi:hypothetical protein
MDWANVARAFRVVEQLSSFLRTLTSSSVCAVANRTPKATGSVAKTRIDRNLVLTVRRAATDGVILPEPDFAPLAAISLFGAFMQPIVFIDRILVDFHFDTRRPMSILAVLLDSGNPILLLGVDIEVIA